MSALSNPSKAIPPTFIDQPATNSSASPKSTPDTASSRPSPTTRHSSFFGTLSEHVHLRSRSYSPPSIIDTTHPMAKRSSESCESPSSSSRPTSPQSPISSKPIPKRQSSSGTYTQCGRHSNDWLFGGFSVTNTVKGLLERKDS